MSYTLYSAHTDYTVQFVPVQYSHGVRYRGFQGVHGPPRIKLGGPVIGLDPPDFFKNIKILCENKTIN